MLDASWPPRGGFPGTSANLSFFQRPDFTFRASGLDARFALGTTLVVATHLALDFTAQLSVGRFTDWTAPSTSLDPNESIVVDEKSATHAFYGLFVGGHIE